MYEVLGRFSETAMNMVASTCRLAGKETHQHDRQVHRHNRLKEEGLEVVGHVGDGDEEDGGDVDGEEGAQEPPPQHHPHLHPPRVSQIKGSFPDKAGWKEKSMYKKN